MASLVDVNVLLAILDAGHDHSARALRWLEGQENNSSVLVCRVVQMGVLRLMTQPALMKGDVLSASQFWKGWDRLMEDQRFAFAEETGELERSWRETTGSLPRGRCAETDAYLAAFSRASGSVLVTFDRGFRRFPGIRLEVLS